MEPSSIISTADIHSFLRQAIFSVNPVAADNADILDNAARQAVNAREALQRQPRPVPTALTSSPDPLSRVVIEQPSRGSCYSAHTVLTASAQLLEKVLSMVPCPQRATLLDQSTLGDCLPPGLHIVSADTEEEVLDTLFTAYLRAG